MNELIDFVARRTGLDRDQADAAVAAALEYLNARLPSPVVGRIHELLHGTPTPPAPGDGAVPPAAAA